MTAAKSQAIGDHELESLLGTSLSAPVALAVSGGADSMALLHLVARYCEIRARGLRDQIQVVTVDHQLRIESAAEAAFVKAEAARLGFSHQTLVWEGVKPQTGLQAAARSARYELISGWLHAEHERGQPLRCLITAHHADDQAETLLMRLARGSGTRGLGGMRARTAMHGITVLRPFLTVPKDRLVETLALTGGVWLEDPSNANTDFERVRLREAQPALSALGLQSGKLALSARRLARADEALERLTDDFAVSCGLNRHGGAYASLDLQTFQAAPAEARVRVLGRLIESQSGQAEAAQLSQIEDLESQICSAGRGTSATLGGCALRWSGTKNLLQVFREAARPVLPVIVISPGQSAVWDRRFAVSLKSCPQALAMASAGPISVRALGRKAYATLRGTLTRDIPAQAGATLPGFFQAETLIAVPYFADQFLILAGPLLGNEPICQARPLF